jgi:hypothetical protein
VDLSDVPGGADYVHGANDLAVAADGTADGTAYVTDIAAGEVYRVTTSGDASLLLQDDRLGRDGVGRTASSGTRTDTCSWSGTTPAPCGGSP